MRKLKQSFFIILLARFDVGSNSTFSPWVLLEIITGEITSEFVGNVHESKQKHILASLLDKFVILWDKSKVTLLAFKKVYYTDDKWVW